MNRRHDNNPNRSLTQAQVLEHLKEECGELFDKAIIVGRWVWIEFDEIPDADLRRYLKELGFHFSRRRSAWQHPCGHEVKRRSHDDPRNRYGAVPVSDMEQETQVQHV